jgi:hypothetical protein
MQIQKLVAHIKAKIKLKKIIVLTSLIILFLFPLFIYFAYLNSGWILAQNLSHMTKTPVTIHQVDFHRDCFKIEQLVVGNPQEAYIPAAFRAKTVEIRAPYSQYLKKSITIDQIVIDDIYINIEFYTPDKIEGNWQVLIENMKQENRSPSKTGRKTLIKELVLTNVQVNLILSDGKIHRLSPIKHLEFQNVTSEEGIPIKEISEIIARKMVYSVLKEEGLNLIIKIPLQVMKKILPFIP